MPRYVLIPKMSFLEPSLGFSSKIGLFLCCFRGRVFNKDIVYCLAFNPENAKQLVSGGGYDKTIRVWDVTSE